MIQHEKIEIHTLALDGLDGSGKGSCVGEIAEILAENGDNVVVVEFPCYEAPWGKVLRKLLTKDDAGLSLEERMAVYAINRIETIPLIHKSINEIQHHAQRKVHVLFDRFVTSNALTLAYYEAKNEKLTHEELNKETLRAYGIMWELDTHFVHQLGLESTHVYVPMLQPQYTLRAIDNDASRKGRDLYETPTVQSIAHTIYKKLAEIDPDRIKLIPQIVQTREMTRRLSQEELARTILSKEGILIHHNDKRGKIVRMAYEQLQIPEYEMNTILVNKFSTDNLRRLNPYK